MTHAEDLLHHLLAIVHRDGGHHTDEVGLDQSVKDAQQVYYQLRGDRSLAKYAHDLAMEQGTTIAVAESLTGGLLASWLTSISGSSAYFKGGVVAYTLESKAELLGVDGLHAAQVNCVSEQVAREMAAGVRKLFGSDIGIATTGYTEPWNRPLTLESLPPKQGSEIAAPMAYFAIDAEGWSTAGAIYGDEDTSRVEMQELVVQGVLRQLVSPALPIIGAMKT